MRSRTASVAWSAPVVSGWSSRHWTMRSAARWNVSFGANPGTNPPDLGGVEDTGVADVAEYLTGPEPVGCHYRKQFGGYVHKLGLDAQCAGENGVDLVPGVDILAGDVENLSDSPRVAEQAD